MRFEVHFGGYTDWCEAGNPHCAAIQTLQRCIEEQKRFPHSAFKVIQQDSGEEFDIGLSEVLAIQQLSSIHERGDAIENLEANHGGI